MTSTNPKLWKLTLHNNIIVHLSHLAVSNLDQRLPRIGSCVKITNAHYFLNGTNKPQKLFLCHESTLDCNYFTPCRDEDLPNFIKEHKLGTSDLLEIDHNIDVINDFIKLLAQDSSEVILLEILKCMLKNDNSNESTHLCLNKTLPPFSLKTISSCKYIDHKSDAKPMWPKWRFGTHSKHEESDCLIGYVFISKYNGMVSLQDVHYLVPCLITGDYNKVRSLYHHFVLIQQYRIFTETYKEARVNTFEYIVFDIKDVYVLNVKPKMHFKELLSEKPPSLILYSYNFEFQLLRKASVSFSIHFIN